LWAFAARRSIGRTTGGPLTNRAGPRSKCRPASRWTRPGRGRLLARLTDYATGDVSMTTDKEKLLTAGDIAKAVKASDTRVKKALKELGIQPAAKKGVCNYYGHDAVAKVKAAVAK
jgi:hypothetical protein